MNADGWSALLITVLLANALLGFGYRLYRAAKGGPLADAVGQAILGALLVAVALGVGAGWSVARWGALAYGLVFGVVVMPVWTLAVLIPMRPGALDVLFTVAYWIGLGAVVVAALAL
jgi:hypothetical protein